jgi:radical SAM protein with 4Fe4S-binding SPASM domain
MAINFDGAVSACCVDWSRDVVVGNVCEQSLSEIWDGDVLRDLRLLHLDGRRSENPACRSCQYLQGASEEADIDGNRRSLRRLYDS